MVGALKCFCKSEIDEHDQLNVYNKDYNYTTAAGTVQHYMQCSDRKECRTTFKINNKTYMDYLQFKMRNNIK